MYGGTYLTKDMYVNATPVGEADVESHQIRNISPLIRECKSAPNMESKTSACSDLPPSAADSLALTHPTPAERDRTWTLTHPIRGPALPLADYLTREAYLTPVPLAKDGGVSH